ncbi:MAG: phosphotransferase [Oscillospiraceae bacterium]
MGSRPICARELRSGSVHDSFLVDLVDGTSVVLQRINTDAFPDTAALMGNALAVSNYLKKQNPKSHRFVRFISPTQGGDWLDFQDEQWRAYRYIDRAHTPLFERPSARDSAEAARAVGLFHRSLADFPVSDLNWTLPDFHNTPKLFDEFTALLETTPKTLVDTARDEISYLLKQLRYTGALLAMDLPARAVHNSIQMSCVLLDNETGRALCLINYDTVMPGLVAFDFGAAVHSACRLCRPDERVMKKIRFDLDRYAEMTRLYIDVMRPVFDKSEPASLAPGAVVMSLELGLRYLCDYLTGNKRFPVSYPEQNLYRARVQLMLCMQMQYYFKEMENIVKRCL